MSNSMTIKSMMDPLVVRPARAVPSPSPSQCLRLFNFVRSVCRRRFVKKRLRRRCATATTCTLRAGLVTNHLSAEQKESPFAAGARILTAACLPSMFLQEVRRGAPSSRCTAQSEAGPYRTRVSQTARGAAASQQLRPTLIQHPETRVCDMSGPQYQLGFVFR
jgi:hypothetical protein